MYLAALILFHHGNLVNMRMYICSMNIHTCISCVSCIQLKAFDVMYGSHSITNPRLLKRAVRDMGYPPTISCAVIYREELRRKGRPVLIRLDLLGADADTELTFMCKAYEEVNHQQLDGGRSGELE